MSETNIVQGALPRVKVGLALYNERPQLALAPYFNRGVLLPDAGLRR